MKRKILHPKLNKVFRSNNKEGYLFGWYKSQKDMPVEQARELTDKWLAKFDNQPPAVV
jgi:hypothetical protein